MPRNLANIRLGNSLNTKMKCCHYTVLLNWQEEYSGLVVKRVNHKSFLQNIVSRWLTLLQSTLETLVWIISGRQATLIVAFCCFYSGNSGESEQYLKIPLSFRLHTLSHTHRCLWTILLSPSQCPHNVFLQESTFCDL